MGPFQLLSAKQFLKDTRECTDSPEGHDAYVTCAKTQILMQDLPLSTEITPQGDTVAKTSTICHT